jgi:oligoribonuclease NrnB/cAMP/cGMP phosphodiesterase (DHH superfamily)
MTQENNRVVCIYHANCLDGAASAWVVEQFFGPGVVEFHAAQYGHPVPEGLTGCTIYLVDFSYKRDQIVQLMQHNNVVILDHHETAAKDLEGLFEIDQAHSGAMVTWNYFFGSERPPVQLLYVQDRDLFQFKLENTKPWTMGAFSYPLSLETFSEIMKRPEMELISEGILLIRKEKSDIGKFMPNVRRMKINGQDVPVVNAPYMYASEIGHLLAQDNDYAVIYNDGVDERQFSLRSRKDGGQHVNLVAEAFGGGGHKNASGFKLKFDDPRFPLSHVELNSH